MASVRFPPLRGMYQKRGTCKGCDMEGSVYTKRGNGYYYDVEEVRYRQSKEDGHEQVA